MKNLWLISVPLLVVGYFITKQPELIILSGINLVLYNQERILENESTN